MLSRVCLVVAIPAITLGLAACTSSSGGPSGNPGFDASTDAPAFDSSNPDGGSCQPPGVSAACTSCLSANCSEATLQSDCQPVIDCYCQCNLGDDCCVAKCGPDVTTACVQDVNSLRTCATKSCASECTVTAPGACNSEAGMPDAGSVDATVADSSTPVEGGAEAGQEAGPGTDGGVVVIAGGQMQPLAIAADGTNVYWTADNPGDTSSGVVLQAPVGGGAITTLASGRNQPQAIAVDATNVYWGDGAQAVVKVPIGGGTLMTLATGVRPPCAMAVGPTDVYWVNCSGNVFHVPIAGGSVSVFAVTSVGGSWGVGINGSSLYWTEIGTVNGVAVTEPLEGGAPVTLDSQLAQPFAITADPNNVYFNDDGFVEKVPLDGGSAVTLGTGLLTGSLAVDATHAYVVGSAGITALSIGGPPTTTLAPSPSANGPLAINATNVYWSTWSAAADAGTIETVAK